MKAYLILEDGMVFEGKSVGAVGAAAGKVVFYNSSSGYQELMTDPSGCNKLFIMTYPLVGNYGVNSEDVESGRVFANGLIMRECCKEPSNFRCEGTLDDYMIKNNVVGIEGIDTRNLTAYIRDNGSMKGAIISGCGDDIAKGKEMIAAFRPKTALSGFPYSRIAEIESGNDSGLYKIALIDCGAKRSFISALKEKGCKLIFVPLDSALEKINDEKPDGIVIAGGVGEPEGYSDISDEILKISKLGIPVFGVGLGHCLLAMAHGFSTYELKYGHHGSQPVKDLSIGKVISTAQNHLYGVADNPKLPEIAKISHKNIHDGSVEGLRYKNISALSVQFNPTGIEGSYLIDEFLELVNTYKEGRGSNA